MTTAELHLMLDPLPDTREVIVRRATEDDVLLAVWRGAEQDAGDAYAAWCELPGMGTHAVYLAAVDQADAAVASLLAERRELVSL